jgi:hypothetical protein
MNVAELKHDSYCAARQPNGARVFGWVVCDRSGRPTHIDLEERDGGKSGVLLALTGLTDVHPHPLGTSPFYQQLIVRGHIPRNDVTRLL